MGRKTARRSRGYRSPQQGPLPPDNSQPVSPAYPLRDDIDDNFARIYESFFLEFEKRVAERQSAKEPLSVPSMQRSTLDNTFHVRLEAKVKTLSRAIGPRPVLELLEGRTLDFIERVLAEVKVHQGDALQLGLLEDAFDVIENAVDVVESLVQNPQGPQSVLRRSKAEFYRLVEEDKQLADLMKWGTSLAHHRAHEMFEERRFFTDEFSEEAYNEQLKSQAVQSMSLEELVLYITESGPHRRNQSSRSTAEGSKSPRTDEETETDREVKEFKRRLEEARTHHTPMKPRLSDEWLKRLSLSLTTALQSAA